MADDYSGITRPYGDTPRTVSHPVQNGAGTPASPVQNFNTPDVNQRSGRTSPDTGDLRRGYNFGNSYTKLSFQRDPFLHHLNTMGKKPTDDWNFKYTIKRDVGPFKQFGYVVGSTANGELVTADVSVALTNPWTGDVTDESVYANTGYQEILAATIPGIGASAFANALPNTQGNTCAILIMGDYLTAGNLSNIINTGSSSIGQGVILGVAGTKPGWFMPDMTIRIPTNTTQPSSITAPQAPDDYVNAKIMSTYTLSGTNGGSTIAEGLILNVRIIKASAQANAYPTSYVAVGGAWSATAACLLDVGHGTGTSSIAQKLEPSRTYVMGSAYHELSGYGAQQWRPQPYSTDYGYTEYFKRWCQMSYRAMSTRLKFDGNPWTEEWRDKTLEMSLQLADTAYWGEQYIDADGVSYTEGLVNFILNNGNRFSLDLTTKNHDNFLEDLSALHDPRYMFVENVQMHYYVNSQVWNWIGKIAGYNMNNVEMSSNFTMSRVGSGWGMTNGVKNRVIDVDGQTMKVFRDIHLDRSHVKMIAVNMKSSKIRPLVGNGINNDVHVFPGVKTKQNSGESYRVDLIDADIGFEFGTPELTAVWV